MAKPTYSTRTLLVCNLCGGMGEPGWQELHDEHHRELTRIRMRDYPLREEDPLVVAARENLPAVIEGYER